MSESLGAIQLFPSRPAAGTLADVWRVAPLPGSGAIKVRPARLEDYAAVRALHRQAQSGIAAPTLKQFESQRQAFAEGQFVAEADGALVGVASSLVAMWDDCAVDPSWKSLTGDGYFTTHDPNGRTLYASDVIGDVSRRGFGVCRALHQARRRLCRRLNLHRIVIAARIPGYRASCHAMPPELYVKRVVWGGVDEPMLRFQLTQGFHYCGVLHDYRPEDEESCGHAALLAWLNPLYAPPGPTACVESQRQRKCA